MKIVGHKLEDIGPEKQLIITVGLPYSGKSTIVKNCYSQFPIVNPDSIRYALHGQKFYGPAEPHVWAITETMVKSLFHAGHNTVILDSTMVEPHRRKPWIQGPWLHTFIEIKTSAETCINRANAVNDMEIIPIIEAMASKLIWPSNNNGK